MVLTLYARRASHAIEIEAFNRFFGCPPLLIEIYFYKRLEKIMPDRVEKFKERRVKLNEIILKRENVARGY